MKDCSQIFALSTMISAVQVCLKRPKLFLLKQQTFILKIYNLTQNIQELDLQYLLFFANYGEVAKAMDERVDGKPFQVAIYLSLLYLANPWRGNASPVTIQEKSLLMLLL